MIFHFILETVLNKMLSSMFKVSAVIELIYFSKGDVWSADFSIRQIYVSVKIR